MLNYLRLCAVLLIVSSAAAEKPPITVCATLPLTGKLAFSGTAVQGALEMGVEELNAKGGVLGRPVRLAVEDNAGEAQRAAVSIKKLIDVDGCRFVLSPLTHLTQAIKAEAARNNLLMLYWAGIDITNESPGFFKDWGDALEDGREIARLVKREGYQRAALLHEQHDACLDVIKGFEEQAAADNVEIVGKDSFIPGETDFRSILLRLSAKKPEVVAVCAWRDSGTIQRQLAESRVSGLRVIHVIAPFLPANDTPELRALYETHRSLSTWFGLMPDDPSPEQQSFVNKFSERLGFAPRMEAAFAYDGIRALGAAITRCGSVETACVVDEFASGSFSGVSGPLRFDSRRRSNRPAYFLEVKAGKWVRAQ